MSAKREAAGTNPPRAMPAVVVLAGSAALALLLSAALLPGWQSRTVCALLGAALAGAAWILHRYHASPEGYELPVSDYHRLLPEDRRVTVQRRVSLPEQQRHLSEIRSLTRRLIDAANREDEATHQRAGGRAGSTRGSGAGSVELARQALLVSVGSAKSNGLDEAAIRTKGFEQAVTDAVAMSDLAYVVVGQIRTRLVGLALRP